MQHFKWLSQNLSISNAIFIFGMHLRCKWNMHWSQQWCLWYCVCAITLKSLAWRVKLSWTMNFAYIQCVFVYLLPKLLKISSTIQTIQTILQLLRALHNSNQSKIIPYRKFQQCGKWCTWYFLKIKRKNIYVVSAKLNIHKRTQRSGMDVPKMVARTLSYILC